MPRKKAADASAAPEVMETGLPDESVSVDARDITADDPGADAEVYEEEKTRLMEEAAQQADDVTEEMDVKENKSLAAEAEAKANALLDNEDEFDALSQNDPPEDEEDDENSPFYGINRASRRKRRNMYNSGNNILAVGDVLEADTPQKRLKAALVQLEASRKGGTILTGRIIGSETMPNSYPCAKILYDGWSILIPITELIPKEMMPEDLGSTPAERAVRMSRLIEAREGATIDFIVRGVDEAGRFAVASRLDAMALMRASYYWRRNRATGNYIISEGQVVEGRVQYANSNGIGVEAFGKEGFVRATECSWKRINPRDVFVPGDKILVKVVKIERTVEGNTRTLTTRMSVKEAYPNQNEIYFDQFKVGQRYAAKVTWVDENGIYCQVGDFEAGEVVQARCMFPKGNRKPPKEGDVIQVVIRSKHEENNFITCDITGRFFSNGRPSKVW